MSTTISLFEAFDRHLDAHPDDLLYRYLLEGRPTGPTLEWSYAETYARSVAVAERLVAQGLANKRVLLLFAPSLDYVAAFLGCLMARAVAVPAYPPDPTRISQTMPRLLAIAEAAGVDAVLTTSQISAIARTLVADTPLGPLDWECIDRLPPGTLTRDWLDRPEDDDVAYLQFTSGSTSAPKGVMVTHANVAHNSLAIRDKFGSGPDSHGVIWLPPYHDMGLVGGIIQPLYVGFATTLMSPVDFLKRPLGWLEAISRFRGTISGGPNFAYELCTRRFRPGEHELDLRSWTLAFNGAEPIRADTLNQFAERFAPHGFSRRAFYPCYGLAEATLLVTGGDHERVATHRLADRDALASGRFVAGLGGDDSFELVSCGAPAEGHQVVVVDPTTGERAAAQSIGEIWVSGPSVTAGYWERPGPTRASFAGALAGEPEAGPFLRTGDLGFICGGELYVTGRIKDLIIIRGRNHYPQDLEATAAATEPAIRGGCVAAFPSDAGGEPGVAIVAEVKRCPDDQLDRIIDAIRSAVASIHAVSVREVALLKPRSMPKTSSGKLRRSACQTGLEDGSIAPRRRWRVGDPSGPSHEAEAADAADAAEIAEVVGVAEVAEAAEAMGTRGRAGGWSERALGAWLRTQLSRHTGLPEDQLDGRRPLIEYGLDSRVSVEIAGELEELLGRSVPATLVWDHPTLDAIAAALGEGSPGPLEVPRPGADAGHAPSATRPSDDAIAIVAVGCRFPGDVDGPESLWSQLVDGRDPISGVPALRWDGRRGLADAASSPARGYGGFIDGVDRFDAPFFHISPREAQALDPQQRLLLEVSWEALDRAGLANRDLAGSATGVFVGISGNDYFRRQDRAGAVDPHYSVTGNMSSVAAGRVAYCLGLVGPALAVDTACSSSLVALHLACQSLRDGDCDRALAGGVSLMLSPEGTLYFDHLHALSPEGRCATFDRDADGYVRSEGCAMLVLERLSHARRAGRPVLAVIRGSAVAHDGRSNGLTAPSGPAQEAVIRRALARAGVEPREISYVEAHGTGTPLGDPIELRALGAVFGPGRPADAPLLIGSVKSNLGHTEAVAGVAGVIKVLLAMRAQVLPANLHFHRPNAHVDPADLSLRVVDRPTPWPRGSGEPRIAGVSSFGFSGTNVHLVLEDAPDPAPRAPRVGAEAPQLVTIAAHGPAALDARIGQVRAWLDEHEQAPHALADLAFSMATSGDHLPQRLAVVASSAPRLRAELATRSRAERRAGPPERLAFLFSGQGSVRAGMGRELARRWTACAAVLHECAEIFARHAPGSPDLREIMGADADAPGASRLSQTEYSQPAIFTLQAMLVAQWRALGVEPDVVLGHSVGEFAAAYCAGAMSLPDAMRLVIARGRGMATLPAGAMASLDLGEAEARSLVRGRAGLTIAAINGPAKTVVSGPAPAIDALEAELTGSSAGLRRLPVSRAFHSPMMEPMIEAFSREVRALRHHAPRITMASTVTGAPLGEGELGPDYWLEHVRAPVRFAAAVASIGADVDAFVELGPGPVLSSLAPRCLPDRGARFLSCGRRGRPEDEALLAVVGALYEAGHDLDLRPLFPHDARRIALPRYPWQHERYWIDAEQPEPAPARTPRSTIAHPLVQRQLELIEQQLGLLGASRRSPRPSEV